MSIKAHLTLGLVSAALCWACRADEFAESYLATEEYVNNAVAAESNRTDKAIGELRTSVSGDITRLENAKRDKTDLTVYDAGGEPTDDGLATKSWAEDAIDSLAAYYITYDVAGAAFPTRSALLTATTVYSGGTVRVPTRNDYAVVLNDEEHGGAEYRYIYAVAEGETEGQWEAQYPIETNDYTGLSNKPSINGVELAGNQTAAELGLATASQGEKADAALPKADVVEPSASAVTGQAAEAKATYDELHCATWYPNGSVKSPSEWTPAWDGNTGIKYAFYDGTAEVLPFCSDGESNAHLSGRVVIPPYVDHEGVRYAVTGIKNGSYYVQSNTTEIIAPTTVTYVGSNAFDGCQALTTVYMPGVKNVYNLAFSSCSSLTTAEFPDATSIANENGTFYLCTNLNYISLDSVTEIGDWTFNGCSSLSVVYFGAVPHTTVPAVGANAFAAVPRSCIFVVPDTQYDTWITNTNWATLYAAGYRFLRHSEWEYARRYETVPVTRTINGKALSSNVTLTGADVAVSGDDPTNIDTALANKANKPTTYQAGDLAAFNTDGDPVDSNISATDVITQSEFAPVANREFLMISSDRSVALAKDAVESAYPIATSHNATEAGNTCYGFSVNLKSYLEGQMGAGEVSITKCRLQSVTIRLRNLSILARVAVRETGTTEVLALSNPLQVRNVSGGINFTFLFTDNVVLDADKRYDFAVVDAETGNVPSDARMGTVASPIITGLELLNNNGTRSSYNGAWSGGITADCIGLASIRIATETDLSGYVPTNRTVNGKSLSQAVTLTGEDIAVTASNPTNIASALESKLDKSGGTMTGRLILPSGILQLDPYTSSGYLQFGGDDPSAVGFSSEGYISDGGGLLVHWPNVVDGGTFTFALAAPDPTAGNLAALDASGNPVDSKKSLDDIRQDIQDSISEALETYHSTKLYSTDGDRWIDADGDVTEVQPVYEFVVSNAMGQYTGPYTYTNVSDTAYRIETRFIPSVWDYLVWNEDNQRWQMQNTPDPLSYVDWISQDGETQDSDTITIYNTTDSSVAGVFHRQTASVTTGIVDKVVFDSYLEQVCEGKANKSDVDPLLFAQYYPEGNVKSAAEFTAGIKYSSFDDVNRTVFVLPFCNTGASDNDNSELVGRVVVPPFVDLDGNGYISDDGTRFKVVGVSGGSSFGKNTNLTAIVAPTTVTTIGDGAFYECSSLKMASMPKVVTINSSAFKAASSLKAIYFPVATHIGQEAFAYTGLETIDLPSVTNIDYYAFAFAHFHSVSLPRTTNIGSEAFNSCSQLEAVYLPVCTSIKSSAFAMCSALASVDFGDTPRDSVPSLGSNAFTSVPTTCKIIVPYMQYDAWIAASGWKDLPQEFVRHAEKADKPATFTEGNLAEFDNNGNPVDSGKSFEDIQNQIDTESPLVARSFPVQQQTGWTEGDVTPTGDSDLKIYLRPRFFGMKDGDLLKGIVLRTRSSGRTPFPSGVYLRIKSYPDGQTLGVSELTVWPDEATTDVVFRFPQAIELPSSGNYYTFDFSTTPNGDAVKLGMCVYVMPSGTTHPDFYFIRSAYVPIATAQFYSWASDLVPDTRTINSKPLSADVTLTGADIAVSTQGTTTINAALDKKLTAEKNGLKYTIPLNDIMSSVILEQYNSSTRIGLQYTANTVFFDGQSFYRAYGDGRIYLPSWSTNPTETLALTAGTGHEGNIAALDSNGNPTNSGIAKTSIVQTNALSGTTYDFSTNRDIIKAVADIVKLLGGKVDNEPTATTGE